MMKYENPARFARSAELYETACGPIPAGVNSTARATWSGWDPYPLFVDRGEGAYLYDVDGNAYIDYLLGLGPMILGHRPPKVTAAVVEQIQNRGTVFALPTAQEAQLAQKIIAVPGMDISIMRLKARVYLWAEATDLKRLPAYCWWSATSSTMSGPRGRDWRSILQLETWFAR